MAACIRNSCCLTRPILHICDASQGTAEVLNCSAVCCMQVIDDVINKLWDKDYNGAKIYQDYEKGLQELLSIITASSPGEHFQLPHQDSSQLAQVSFSFAFCPHPLSALGSNQGHPLSYCSYCSSSCTSSCFWCQALAEQWLRTLLPHILPRSTNDAIFSFLAFAQGLSWQASAAFTHDPA